MKPQYTKPLPPCDGPKLKPFHDPEATVLFHRLISDKDTEGNCAHVFEVSIGRTKYALKVFKFYNVLAERIVLSSEEEDLFPNDIFEARCDPFYRECRAYGRLEEKKLNGKVAARCYGYTTIPADEGELFWRKFDIHDWHRPNADYGRPISERQPFRAIVKELIPKDVPLTGRVADRILRDMKRMRRCGVYPRDVHPRNYVGGHLVDFSEAMTTPYWLFQVRPDEGEMIKDKDLYKWQKMVEANQLDTRSRAFRNQEYCAKLWSRKAKARRTKK